MCVLLYFIIVWEEIGNSLVVDMMWVYVFFFVYQCSVGECVGVDYVLVWFFNFCGVVVGV